MKALSREITHFYDNEPLKTLYFGGGTPSVLEIEEFENIIRFFKILSDTEITSELNPEDVSYDYLRRLYETGINRISMGCQTFNDNILKLINRRHNSKQVINSVIAAQKAGFDNVSLDFIYGLPEQTIQMFIEDLKLAVGLGVQHISLYGLKLEEGCYFYDHCPDNLPDDDVQADMYLEAVELLKSFGFEHYEVSNFSLKGKNSKHNLAYWNNEEYYGFGVAAHGYKNGIRYGNKEIIEDYINDPFTHKEEKLLLEQEKLEEEIFLGLRKISGINIEKINQKYNIDFSEKYNDILKKYENLNLLAKTQNGYAFTPQGVLVSNAILADFIEEH